VIRAGGIEPIALPARSPNLNAYAAVSYTHLDVYKRQILGFAQEHDRMYVVVASTVLSVLSVLAYSFIGSMWSAMPPGIARRLSARSNDCVSFR